MSRETRSSPLDLQALAAGAAHSLNNLVGVLDAADDWLAAGDQADSAAEVQSSLHRARMEGRALSAAFMQLALCDHDASALEHAGPFELLEDDLVRLANAVETIANIEPEDRADQGKCIMVPLDRDTLESLLVCAAVAVRREAGRDVTVRMALESDFNVGTRYDAIVFRIFVNDVVTLRRPGANVSHPCNLALEYARGLLDRIGVNVQITRPGEISVGLRPGVRD